MHTRNGILPPPKKEENPGIYNSKDVPGEHMLGEISQREEDKYCMVLPICGYKKEKKKKKLKLRETE